MKTFTVALRLTILGLICCQLNPTYAQKSVSGKKDKNVVYMLTYDHGGLILWGSDHFQERLQNAISWLDKYPSFKIGLDNESQIYDYFNDNERDSHSPFVHEEKLRFKMYPELGSEIVGIRDLPFAISETDYKYIEGNYWTAISDGEQGISIFTKGNMGTVREQDEGISIPLAYAMYYIWGTRMLYGHFSYEFALYPFSGNWQKSDIHKKSIAYNFPLPQTDGNPGNGSLGDNLNLLDIKADNVILSALYPTDGGICVRFYEFGGQRVDPEITWKIKNADIREVNLLGKESEETLHEFKPWEIKTYIITH